MPSTPPIYQRRSPADGVLYRIVRDHFETFRAQAATLRDGEGLPLFVEQAFRDFLRCGWLAGGFARFQCAGCGCDRLVAFSCKGRALCPSCGGRRMAERAAHLVDRVLPDVPIRQWVLSVPYRLRYRLAWDHDLCRAVAGVLARSVIRTLRDRAREAGVARGHGGAVVVIQRFGGALNLNVHFHALVPDGVFAGEPGRLAFHRVGRLTALDAEEVLAAIEPLVDRRRRATGESDDDGMASDRWVDAAPVLAGLAAASVQGVSALAPRGWPSRAPGDDRCRITDGAGGHRLVRRARPRVQPARRSRRAGRAARAAGARVPLRPAPAGGEGPAAPDRGRSRAAHPAASVARRNDRVGVPAAGAARTPGRSGTAAANQPDSVLWCLRCAGHRTGGGRGPWDASAASGATADKVEEAASGGNRSWAVLMQRTFGLDVLACPRCGGRFRLIALIEQPAVITRVLGHLGLPPALPVPRPARPPPDTTCWDELAAGGETDVFTPAS